MASDLSKVKIGQQVLITIGDNRRIEGDYYGTVCVINKKKTSIHLKDVEYGPAQQKLSGTKRFFLPEILAIKIISDVHDDSGDEQATETMLEDRIKFELNAKQKENIKSLIRNRCMIETVGDEYEKALHDIFHYYYVGLAAQVERGESYVVCCTPHKIYVFNIKTIGGINGKFKEWFESDTHTKVVHGTNILKENLFYCHEIINVRGVFDTKAVQRMLESHIELSSGLIEEMDCGNASRVDTLIDRTAILLKLHDFLTEHLLTNAYQLFQQNMDYFRSMTSVEVELCYRRGK